MPFRVRNTFYLRISATDVIPFYVYLDERHVDWMSHRTLQSVVADLKPLIGPKLEAERYAHFGPGGPATAKKATVEVQRGDSYQFAYFLRKAEPHAVVLKTRNYVMVNKPVYDSSEKTAGPVAEQGGSRSTANAKGKKRARKTVNRRQAGKGKGKVKAVDVIDVSEDEAEDSSLSEIEDSEERDGMSPPRATRRSTRNKRPRMGSYRERTNEDDNSEYTDADEDVVILDECEQDVRVKEEVNDADVVFQDSDVGRLDEDTPAEETLPPDFGVDEDEEKKLKPELQLSFRGLHMSDRYLCVVVEPWPALPSKPDEVSSRAASRAPSVLRPGLARESSIAPSCFGSSLRAEDGREQTPLFLPDPSGRDRSTTPAPMRFPSEFPSLETMETIQGLGEDDDGFGMLAFSQVLNNVSGDRVGPTEEDDEMDGGALYGDADEMRDII